MILIYIARRNGLTIVTTLKWTVDIGRTHSIGHFQVLVLPRYAEPTVPDDHFLGRADPGRVAVNRIEIGTGTGTVSRQGYTIEGSWTFAR